MTSLRDLGLKTVINADARVTQLGGSALPAPVLEAMTEVARSTFVVRDVAPTHQLSALRRVCRGQMRR